MCGRGVVYLPTLHTNLTMVSSILPLFGFCWSCDIFWGIWLAVWGLVKLSRHMFSHYFHQIKFCVSTEKLWVWDSYINRASLFIFQKFGRNRYSICDWSLVICCHASVSMVCFGPLGASSGVISGCCWFFFYIGNLSSGCLSKWIFLLLTSLVYQTIMTQT